jgi:hypothetical protein
MNRFDLQVDDSAKLLNAVQQQISVLDGAAVEGVARLRTSGLNDTGDLSWESEQNLNAGDNNREGEESK